MKDKMTVTQLLLSDLQLFQHEDEFKFSIDAVLLAHFGTANPSKRYLDMGTGTGVIPHILYHRGARKIVGVDVNSRVIALAKKSVIHNGLMDAIRMEELDYMSEESKDLYGQFDGIYINPPYFDLQCGAKPQEEGIELALHESISMVDILQQAQRFLKYGGTLWIIYTMSRLETLIQGLDKTQFALKRMRCIHGHARKEAKLVLLELRYGGKVGLRVEPPIYIYETDGSYTEEVKAYYEPS